MNIFAGFETFLYIVSSILLFPVVVGLTAITFWVVISIGAFLREYLERKRGRYTAIIRYKKKLSTKISSSTDHDILGIDLEKLLQSTELDLLKSLDKIKFVIKTGPALGLMGTLIPMGVSLSALAEGSMPKMASNMVTAFTTVVVGLACSTVAYVVSLVKERWIKEDIMEMEYHTEMVTRERPHDVSPLKQEDGNEVS